ncbi:NAD(P)H-hydrate dehydratase [Holzapfeliella sp. JNUCC 80]
MEEITIDSLTQTIKKRETHSHKGSYGRLLLIGGNYNYGGAITMAAKAAVYAGAGLVSVATHSINLPALHANVPEAMFVDWRDQKTLVQLIRQVDVVVLGPGLGQDDYAKKLMMLVKETISSNQTIVLDADALNNIAQNTALTPRNAKKIIMTPHQVEWQRLTGLKVEFQDEKANQTYLQYIAKNLTVVLKSEKTAVFESEHEPHFIDIGTPAMATGGMGDTLAGIIAAFVGQFGEAADTIYAAVYLHSFIANHLSKSNYVVLPSKLIDEIPHFMSRYSQK